MQKKIRTTITLILLFAITFATKAVEPAQQPTLVVGIVVDQLRSDYLDLLKGYFGKGGFNRLRENAVVYSNVDFGIRRPDAVSATAMIFTGAYPHINGITSAKIYDAATRQEQNILSNAETIGNFTNEKLSPQRVGVSTIADEIRVNSGALGYVYSIAPDAQQAIIMAGHAGNGAAWINDVTGNWASTTFYKEDFPITLQMRNYGKSLASRLDTMFWRPSIDFRTYPDIPTHRKFYPFKYAFPRSEKDRYRLYKESALVNIEVTDVAIEYLKTLQLGKRGQLDMLNIAYTAAPYSRTIDPDFRLELQDTYLKLDAQLERLFKAIDSTVGMQNTVVFLCSTGYFNDLRIDDEKYNIPTGEFNLSRSNSLLNMYLIALYGNGEWTIDYSNNQIYLNRALIKERDKNLEEVRRTAADFVRRMSGVREVFTLDDIINNPVTENARRIARAITPETAGDIFVDIKPGWKITKGTPNAVPTPVRENSVMTPAFIMAPGVKASEVTEITDATFLAPTITSILRVRAPNAASHKPAL